MPQKKKIIWIELLRIVSCFSIIVLHAASQHFRDTAIDSFTWQASNFYHGITRFAVSCFVMISGALYLDRSRSWNLKKLWTRNILYIAVAYVFWELFYAVYRVAVKGSPAFGTADYVKKVLVYISKSYFHLWYLPMLIGLLILTPLLWEIVNSARGKQWEEYLILLFVIFQVLPYTVNYFPLPWKEYIMNLLHTVQPELVTSYAGYFILGHYLYEYGISKKAERAIYILGPLMILAGIWLCRQKSLATDKAVQSFYENYTLFAFFWSTAVFLFFRDQVSRIRWSEKKQRFICRLGGCTFGIFLIHAFVRSELHRHGVDSMMIGNTMLAIPLTALLIFMLSWILVLIIKKIPVIGKWIV